jgi:hypothetical protein
MTPKTLDLKTRFRMALAATGMAKEVAGVVPEHLSLVINQKRESKRLLEKVEDFTSKTLKKVRAA